MAITSDFKEAVKYGGLFGLAALSAKFVMLASGSRLYAAIPIVAAVGIAWWANSAYKNSQAKTQDGPQPGPQA